MNIDSVLSNHGIGVSGGDNIKSYQKGQYSGTSFPTTITISEVDLTKSIVRMFIDRGSTVTGSESFQRNSFSINFVDSKSIKIDVNASTSSSLIYWEVIEFKEVKSLQTGSLTLTSKGSNVSISKINPSKSILLSYYKSTDVGSYYANGLLGDFILDETTIRFTQRETTSNKYILWQLVEFK